MKEGVHMGELPKEILDLIALAVTQATQQTAEALRSVQQGAPERNYFKIMEKLLYSYPTLKRIVSDKNKITLHTSWQDQRNK